MMKCGVALSFPGDLAEHGLGGLHYIPTTFVVYLKSTTGNVRADTGRIY